jgi:hypothetical protein
MAVTVEIKTGSRTVISYLLWHRGAAGENIGGLCARAASASARSQGVIAMDVTYYVALTFVDADDGVAAGEAVECPSANAAVMRAEALSRKPGCAGAIAFSRSGDPATGEFGDAKLIRKFGEVPEDLSTL